MDDAQFAALERRLRKARIETYAGTEYLHDVLALLEECRRLRQPPDAAGLLAAAERAGTPRRAERDLPQTGYAGGQCLRLLRHAEAQEAHIRQLEGVVADLREGLARRGG